MIGGQCHETGQAEGRIMERTSQNYASLGISIIYSRKKNDEIVSKILKPGR